MKLKLQPSLKEREAKMVRGHAVFMNNMDGAGKNTKIFMK